MNALKKIYIRYNIKREYFILLLPALIAIMLIVVSILPATSKQSQGTKIALDQIIVFAVLMTITPYSIDVYLENKRKRRYEEEFIGFLYELSELLRGGLDPLNAIKEIAKSLKSPLISKYSYLIVQASRLGAINPSIILKAADDLEKTLQLERDKEGDLKEDRK